ncbi:MAG: hypothetical protein IPO88_20265 [Nannocystis sp.]|uniref:hypothetical protein n=1 Tax=Nannocystis sp. TaxID=1962667 RepID=UPI002420AFFE|nr:hypothetical protein [Nannocystis sp.]MBK9755796.1 hypothetical protein [Nannocystis sp.]
MQRAKAELVVDTDPEDAAAKFKAAATLYRAAAAKLVESNEQRVARAELLDLAMTMYLSSYKLRPGDTTLLRVALAMLHAHDAAYRQAYGERRTAFPEHPRDRHR